MKIYYSETLQIDSIEGLHILQDHLGTAYRSPWNDFGFIITFNLYYTKEKLKRNIGKFKILANGHDDTSVFFKENGVRHQDKIYRVDEIIDIEKIVSLGGDLDFYKKINSLFSVSEVEEILKTICDAGYHQEKYDEYSKWNGFSGSFMRGSSSEAILKKGFQIASGRYIPEKKFQMTLSELGDFFEPVTFKFDNSRDVGKSNINLLIGKNGVGKSHLLKSISEIITGLRETNDKKPYFHKLIVIAFSPFENFYTKNEIFDRLSSKYLDAESKPSKMSKTRKRLHVNEYAYIGFKNDDGFFDTKYPARKSIESISKVIAYDRENNWWDEKSRFDILKETLSLCINFDKIFILDVNNNEIQIDEDFKIEKIKDSINFDKGLIFKKNDEPIPLSSGQIIYSYIIPSVIAEIEEESLLVIDEPELYLHPSLEVGIINMLKHILNETKSFSILATHSAIIAREVERNSINILKRENKKTTTNISSIETYGESLELIISEVFDDSYIAKPYQTEIDVYLKKNHNTIGELHKFVGDDALAYALSQIDGGGEIKFRKIDEIH